MIHFLCQDLSQSAITAGTDFEFPLMAYFNDPIYTCLLSYCIALSNGWPPMNGWPFIFSDMENVSLLMNAKPATAGGCRYA